MHLIARISRRLSGAPEGGFTMVAMMGTLMVVTLFTIAALSIAQNDQPLARVDQDKKQAYAAAEAGIADYFFHLNQDNAYWSKCTGVPSPSAVNQAWNGTGADPRANKKFVPNSPAWYTIELLPANGYATCDSANATASMIDSTSGTFRIRATGHSRNQKRTIVATFRRKNFLDFLYFTDYETSDPSWYIVDTNGAATRSGTSPTWTGGDLVTWGSNNCAKTYWRQGRGNLQFVGQIAPYPSNGQSNYTDNCTEIQFAPGDVIRGPLHTNDEIMVCGSPTFGRNAQDRIEVSGPGWRGAGCGGDNPNFVGTWTPNAPLLTLPPTDNTLSTVATSAYRFTGTTTIVLNGANMTVTNQTMGLNNASMALPSNGVIYVQNGVCGVGYQPLTPYADPQGCADVYVHGSYSQDLTIATEKDIIVNGNTTRSGDVMLGLIANNFVRIYHPTTTSSGGGQDQGGDGGGGGGATSCTNATGTMTNVQIDGAILSLQHSFTVDSYFCGAALGTLTINGAIGQKFRGPVGRGGGGGISNGYTKNYNYDDRMRFRSPPHFLDPVQAAWRISRYTEQVPAR